MCVFNLSSCHFNCYKKFFYAKWVARWLDSESQTCDWKSDLGNLKCESPARARHQGAMAMLWDNVQGQSTVKVSLCPTGGHTSWKSMVESDQKFFWAATLRLRGRATDRGRRISIKHLIFCDRLSPNQNWTATGHVSEHDTARHHWTVRCPPCDWLYRTCKWVQVNVLSHLIISMLYSVNMLTLARYLVLPCISEAQKPTHTSPLKCLSAAIRWLKVTLFV